MPDTKVCPVCATTFPRPHGTSASNWARRKYCSHACADARARTVVRTGCPVRMGRGYCAQAIVRWGLCDRHAGHHERLCLSGCGRCRGSEAGRVSDSLLIALACLLGVVVVVVGGLR